MFLYAMRFVFNSVRSVQDLVNGLRISKLTIHTSRDIAVSGFIIYYKIKSKFFVYSPMEECSIGIAIMK